MVAKNHTKQNSKKTLQQQIMFAQFVEQLTTRLTITGFNLTAMFVLLTVLSGATVTTANISTATNATTNANTTDLMSVKGSKTMKVRDKELTSKEIEALEHLKQTATRKRFYAEFVANLYNGSMFKCDVAMCARYIAGEAGGDNRLQTAFNLMLSLAADGIESHEYLGVDFVEGLIKEYGLKEQAE